MTKRQEHFAWLVLIVMVLLILLELDGNSQTLQRRDWCLAPDEICHGHCCDGLPNSGGDYIGTLAPMSCRDQMAQDRAVFAVAESLEVSKSTKRDLRSLVKDLGRPAIVARVCSNKKVAGYVNLMAADASYRMATTKLR